MNNHESIARSGLAWRMYDYMRDMLKLGAVIRTIKLCDGLTDEFAKEVERALITELGKFDEGGLLLNRGGYYCDSREARDYVRRRKRKWFPALYAPQ
jgi:hypothetical protein